jgi:hypothetical protein
LSGEVLHQGDLLVSKGTNFLAIHDERANQFVLLKHRNGYKCTDTTEFNGGNDVRIAFFNIPLIRRQIGNVNQRFCRQHICDGSILVRSQR